VLTKRTSMSKESTYSKPPRFFSSKVRDGEGSDFVPTIKNMAEENRPREKMLANGEEALTTAELLAILIGSGSLQKNAVELMQEILHDCDDKLMLLSRLSVDDLKQYKGIGEAKALTLKAAMEIGRRRTTEEMSRDLVEVKDAQTIYRYMHPKMKDLPYEECWALMLNNRAKLLKRVQISQGGITETSVDIRLVMKNVLFSNATALVLVHNHPSGSCRPSRYDDQLTRALQEACRVLNIRLMDHVIVTDGDYYSYAEEGKI